MKTNAHSCRVAAVQASPVYMDLNASIDKAVMLITEAAKKGASLIAFPENFLPGYPWFVWLGTPAWAMQFMNDYHNQALVVDSEQYQRIEKAAADNQIHIVMGFTEKDNGSLYMSQAFIDDNGNTIATRRKLKPTLAERLVFGEGDGGDIAVHDTALGKLGALCCWEHIQPLTKFAMYSQHEQIHVAAWPGFSLYTEVTPAIGGEVNIAVSRTYAVEGQCYVIAPCALVTQDTIDLLCSNDEQRRLLKTGGGFTRIYGPDGASLVNPLKENEEGILYAEVNLDAITLAKVAGDAVGHYSRNDVTRLIFNNQSLRPVHRNDLPVPDDGINSPAEDEQV
ncbi:TPA: carbon-nitrogen hydrolase family protein [Raoultella planticola]|uniref:carbon-nitrogen hydrolase family protein n=1 Tax=Raoultella planticola TaxID=575 RepID=UPI001A2E48A0|nr:carbon-nitrogen hydrolase family protein [Raoultella planticola]HAT1623128.1 carbon-nitrogen hydrolase family protein [Raoultella planticola]HAT1644235.1 carbon-nitrogen hydrolase family protein [Raoultella planticola]